MHNIILTAILLIFGSASASAQFYTITKEKEICPEKTEKVAQNSLQKRLADFKSCKKVEKDSLAPEAPVKPLSKLYARKVYTRVSHEKRSLKRKTPTGEVQSTQLPELTIHNLYHEILQNGILYPKIVLAQAILETGWFTSPLCRYRHNLFGLTNPRTGKYYEFVHWTESVRAYYTKVQCKYIPKNKKNKSEVDYLIWLHEIGYAEDIGYIPAVIQVVKKYL